ncbi:MAG: NAD(P)/FAD-dependent oxidoreductase, partial [Candidatus Micrarchaeota archaeon]|nr:NAD(P)/FAD-dependent oxidoreductase [Candidatus Micrarchaeota archaeon]
MSSDIMGLPGMKNEYDIIVVGAGPAGSIAAREAAKKGASVLVLDRRKELGAPVRCGEGLGAKYPEKFGIKLSPAAISAYINGARVVAPNLKDDIIIKTSETKGYVLDRKVFDKDLAKDAARAGASVFSKAEVYDLIQEDGKVKGVRVYFDGSKREVRSKIVIAADGAESVIARLAGMKDAVSTLYDTDYGMEYEMANVKLEENGRDYSDLIELFFGREWAPRGYTWIFPKGKDVANIGVGIGGLEAPNAIHYLHKFIADPRMKHRLGNASIVATKGGAIPVCQPIKEFTKDGLMVAGTAAHQVDPIHGGGIGLAMNAGRLAGLVAAECALENKADKASLDRYKAMWYEEEWGKFGKRLTLRKVLEKMNDDDFNSILSTINDEDIDLVLRGNFAPVVQKVLAKRPQLLKVLTVLI